ncbi:MAG: hypothetical protein HYV47_01900 [Candidatus Nealsonbacteria bacterium]|nr:hypothetical protein [Candidatus Nealsonbacteria bacterium]
MDDKVDAAEMVKSHLQKWVAVAETTNQGGNKQKIEELLQRRLKYLGLHSRKMIWCESPEDMQKKLANNPLTDTITDCRKINSYRLILHREVSDRCKEFSHEETVSLVNLLGHVSDSRLSSMNSEDELTHVFTKNIEISHDKLFRYWNWTLEEFENFFGIILDWSLIAYEDSLWHGLPEETKNEFKNYFAYLGEACEAGLTIWIPTRKREYLFCDARPFFNGNDAKKNLPRLTIDWSEISDQIASQKEWSEPISIILEKLGYFKTRLDAENISQDIIDKVAVIIGEINKLLPLLKKEYPNTSLIFEARRIASNYLIELLESYLRLPDEFRQREQEALLEVLQLLHRELLDADKNIEGVTVREFKVMTEFLKNIYSPENLEM